MAGLLKNQIAKQLARFTKNLSPSQISLKFLKGEGELNNLELNERVLSDLLELPPWLSLTKAVCNKITAKIHWTKLKTDPICLYLDCVEVDMETVLDAEPAKPPPQIIQTQVSPTTKERPATKYGFVEKVVDGMYVSINSVVIQFQSPGFRATFQMSRLIIRSTTPEWEAADLRMTRVKDEMRGEVLTFKEITWSTLRLDADALYSSDQHPTFQNTTPLRLITSNSSLHLTIKKRVEDCTVLSARLELILDDILWVLTHSQLCALARLFSTVNKAMTKNRKQPGVHTSSAHAGSGAPVAVHTVQSVPILSQANQGYDNKQFLEHDVLETSYHIKSGRIDLHLCDDSSLSQLNDADNLQGGAMQIQINKLSVDSYPYHVAGTSRTHWECHNEASLTRAYWVKQLLDAFKISIKNQTADNNSPLLEKKQRLSRTNSGSTGSFSGSASPNPSQRPSQASASPAMKNKQAPKSVPSRCFLMYESSVIIRCEEFAVNQVTTNKNTSGGNAAAFISSDKKALYLPSDMSAFQFDYTSYYYSGPTSDPVPSPNMFVQVNPIQLTLDFTTCLWFNRFLLSVMAGLNLQDMVQQEVSAPPQHVDIRIEALMPKITVPFACDPSSYYLESRPQGLRVQMSQIHLTNSRIGSNCTQTDLLMSLQQFLGSKLYTDYHLFPNLAEDVRPLPNTSWINDTSLLTGIQNAQNLLNGSRRDILSCDTPSQVWCINAEQVWVDFVPLDPNKRPVPFIDAFPLSLWICTPVLDTATDETDNSQSERTDSCNSDTSVVSARPLASDISVSISANSCESFSAPPESEGAMARSTSGSSTLQAASNGVDQKPRVFSDPSLDSSLNDHRRVSGEDSSSSPSRSASLQNAHHSLCELGSKASNLEMHSEISRSDPYISSTHLKPTEHPRETVSACASTRVINKDPEDDCLSFRPLSPPPPYESPRRATRVEDIRDAVIKEDTPPLYTPFAWQNKSGACESSERLPEKRSASQLSVGAEDQRESDREVLATCSVIVNVSDTVNIQLDHFQYIFLMRLQERLAKLQDDLAADARRFMDWSGSQAKSESGPVLCSVITHGAEVAIILPPSPEKLPSDPTVPTSLLSQASSLNDVVVTSGADSGVACSSSPGTLATQRSDIAGHLLEVEDVTSESSARAVSSLSTDSATVSSGDLILSPRHEDIVEYEDNLSGRSSITSATDFDWQAINENTDKQAPYASQTRRDSDVSSGTGLSIDAGSRVRSGSPSDVEASKAFHDKVSVVLVRGTDVHLGIQLLGQDSTVKVTVQDAQLEEKGNLSLEKFLNQRSRRSYREKASPPPSMYSTPVAQVRLEFGPSAIRNDPSAPERGYAHVKVNDVAANLRLSNAEGLAECFEDELDPYPPPMPVYIEVERVRATIMPDLPPRLLSAPSPIPMQFNVERTVLRRTQDGVFHVVQEKPASESKQQSSRDSDSVSDEPVPDQLAVRVSELEGENERLMEHSSVMKATLLSVQQERDALLQTIDRLQQELTWASREQDQLTGRLADFQKNFQLKHRNSKKGRR